MKAPKITPEQRAALDRAKNGGWQFRAFAPGSLKNRYHQEQKVVPGHARLVRK